VRPTADEVTLFRAGGHNAEMLAALSYAKRTGLPVAEARARLRQLCASAERAAGVRRG
jgi:hypothetical protein